MLSDLRKKVEGIAEGYAEFIDERLQTMKNAKRVSTFEVNELSEGVRILNYVLAILERINCLQRGDPSPVTGLERKNVSSEKEVKETMEHFGIAPDEDIYLAKNNDFMKKVINLETIITAHEKQIKKARIIIDYDKDFPYFTTRIISQ